MNKWLVLWCVTLMFCLTACILDEPKYQDDAPPNLQAELDSSYTFTEAVYINEKKVGYTTTFNEPPIGSKDRELAHIPNPGTRFIMDLDFTRIGFMDPYGKTFKYNHKNEPVEFCHMNIKKNLAYFFETPFGKVELKPISEE